MLEGAMGVASACIMCDLYIYIYMHMYMYIHMHVETTYMHTNLTIMTSNALAEPCLQNLANPILILLMGKMPCHEQQMSDRASLPLLSQVVAAKGDTIFNILAIPGVCCPACHLPSDA